MLEWANRSVKGLNNVTRPSKEPFTQNLKVEAHLQFNGAAKGNPGKARAGGWIFIRKEGTIILYDQGYLREINNLAEYEGLLNGAHIAKERGVRSLVVKGDCKLVVNQLGGGVEDSLLGL
eukprot:Gb_27987 [translate_table: standard]